MDEDSDENELSNENDEYGDYVWYPAVILINMAGSGITFAQALSMSGESVVICRRETTPPKNPEKLALTEMIMEAVKGISVDIVIFDRV